MDKNEQTNKADTFVGVNGEVINSMTQTTGLGFANRDEGAKNE